MSNVDPREALVKTLAWSKDRDYAGHSKHDALNSPFLNGLSLNLKWPRLLLIQSVMRAPVNVRGALGVPRLRNPKGVALFAHAWLNLAEDDALRAATPWDRETCLGEADALLTWLVARASPWAPGSEAVQAAFGVKNAHPRPDPAAARAATETADRLTRWTLDHLYSGDGWFYYQQTPRRTKRFCLMRWCNAWMCRALTAERVDL